MRCTVRLRVYALGVLLTCLVARYGYCAPSAYVIGVEDIQYLPHYSYENGRYKGFGAELLNAFAAHKGYHFVYQARPVKRLFSEYLQDNKFDFKYPDNEYWQFEQKQHINIAYSEAIAQYTDGVMILAQAKRGDIEALKILGTIRAFTPWSYLDLIAANKISVHESNTSRALLQMALLNRINGAYLNVDVANYQLQTIFKQPGALVFDPKLPHIKSNYHLSSIKHPHMVLQFNQFLKQKKAMINELKKRYKIRPID